jgi:5-hydroxyisourate hydrolase
MALSTHILNTATGRPAADVAISLHHRQQEGWVCIASAETDADGRWKFLSNQAFGHGVYRLHFATGDYFAAQGLECLYPYVEIVFEVREPARHYHIPLLLTPNGYTTYRGS